MWQEIVLTKLILKIMIPTIGFSLLLLAFILAVFQPCFTAFNRSIDFIKYSTIFIFAFCFSSFLSLVYSYVISDYSVLNVYQNSHHLKPLIYKISGSWGNHEGSVLLLTLILSIYNFAFANFNKIALKQKVIISTIQSIIIAGFLAFIIFTSNPFLRVFPVPNSGLGLNPLLQDIGLAIHPPMLYIGYIGFSLIFSFAISCLLTKTINKNTISNIAPWLMFSWSFLTLGIGLGSWWAYRELGWGGYWFWDPVENVSLMPWLCSTALLHSLIITKKTSNFKVWSCFLAILTFVFSLLGIFLVRSGVLTSVHSFANDPTRGVFIILLLLCIGGGGFLIFALQSSKLKSNKSYFTLFSKSGFILINNFLLTLALFTIALGTLYPLFLEILADSSISIGAPYYNKLFTPLAILILSLMIFVPFLRLDKSIELKKIAKKLAVISLASVTCLFLLFLVEFEIKVLLLLLILLSLAVLFSGFFPFINYKKLNLSYYSMFLAHSGFAIVIMAIVFNALLQSEKELAVKIGDQFKIAGYDIKFSALEHIAGKNYIARKGIFEVKKEGDNFVLEPESRYYPVADKNTTEAAIKHNIFDDLYLALGGKDEKENFAVRIHHKPFISFLWVGCLLIVSGGIFSVTNRFDFSQFQSF